MLAARDKNGPDLLLAFLDGEECLESFTAHDGLHGSRRLAETLVKTQAHRRVIGVILLDMVGDKNLSITLPANSTPELVMLALTAARDAGARERFSLSNQVIVDDHLPFMRFGMPAIDLIDFDYGPGTGRNEYWHTPQDTFDKLSADSLRVVGEVALRMVDALSRRPIRPAARPSAP
jgi:glutaminyl-peptide cyclotransferase